MPNFFVTTPIYYVNDRPHIGHLYTTLAADILARFHKKQGDEVFFLTGTDEHGAKVAQASQQAGKNPKQLADEVAEDFKKAWQLFKIEPNRFIRTTDEDHIKYAQKFLSDLHQKGEIYQGTYEGLYCVACEAYYKPDELLDGKLDPVHRQPVEQVKEAVWFFKLSGYQKQLIELINRGELQIEPKSRKNEVLSFLKKEQLRDIPITRSKVEWGIKVPWDKGQTFYVWIEALLNYLTASEGKKIWPAEIQLIGKDILRFHAVIWPAMLLAAGLELPKKIFVHGFFTVNGAKMSKTQGNVITPQQLADRYGIEASRILLFLPFSFGEDGDFSFKFLDREYNAKLANDLGNLLQRIVVLLKKSNVKCQMSNVSCADADAALKRVDFRGALEAVFLIVTEANQYIDKTKPWSIKDKRELEQILVSLSNRLLTIAAGIEPFAPETAAAIREQLTSLKPKPLFPKLQQAAGEARP